MVRIDELFNIEASKKDKKFAVLVNIGSKKLCLLVDRLIGQHELVIKAIDKKYARTRLLAGASLLGDGRIVLILDAPSIFKKAVEDEKERTAGSCER